MNLTVLVQNASFPQCETTNETADSKAGKTVAYAIIMLMSLIGNFAIVLVIYKTPRLRTTTNLSLIHI